MDFKKVSMRGLFMLLAMSLVGCVVSGGLSAEKTPDQTQRPSPTHHIDEVPTHSQELTDQKNIPTREIETPKTATQTSEKQTTPTVRQGLQASNPDSVVSASGKIQLVEFFAFW